MVNMMVLLPFIVLVQFFNLIESYEDGDPKESCSHLVYCQGLLLDTVQKSRIYPDSKTFVDLTLINSQAKTLKNFNEFYNRTNQQSTKNETIQFVKENFLNSTELEEWQPEDYIENPRFLEKIKDKKMKHFASDIVKIWPTLGRKIIADVFNNSEKHSLIGVPHGFIIPGGRFKELYYWDSYWIIKGLLLSEMRDTARGMIENLLYMVKKYGFIPNGGRVYYLNRSQPPMLTLMANLYYDYTKDLNWVKQIINLLDKELEYWLTTKTLKVLVNNKNYRLAHYISESTTPRPESYYEDLETCSFFTDNSKKKVCYQGLKSGAESGWDFSSRWLFDDQGGTATNLTHIEAQRVIPVDLNSFLCEDFQIMSKFYALSGDADNAKKYALLYEEWLNSIQEIFYDNDDGIWYDFDYVLKKKRKYFYASNFAPLWTGSYDLKFKDKYGEKAAKYFFKENVGDFMGGIPTSLINDNEQWDLPNAWPPLQELIILGLWNTGNPFAKNVAKKSTKNWIEANLKGFRTEGAMFEKYSAENVGQYGGGGEYEVQKGFGWTNGVALNLINIFYTRNKLKA